MNKIYKVALLWSVQSVTILESGESSQKVSVAKQPFSEMSQPAFKTKQFLPAYNQASNVMRPAGTVLGDSREAFMLKRFATPRQSYHGIVPVSALPIRVMTQTPLEQKLMSKSLKMRYESIYQEHFDDFLNKLQHYISEAKSLEEAQLLLHNYMVAVLITVREKHVERADHVPALDLIQLLRKESQNILKQLGVECWEDMVQAGDEQTKQKYTQRIEDMLFEFVRYKKNVDQRYPVGAYRAPVKRYAVAWLQYIRCYLDARWEAFNRFK